MIFLLLFLNVLPDKEILVYEFNDKGKIGTMDIRSEKDTLGYHVVYKWEDRVVEIAFDTLDMSTVYIHKTIGGKLTLEVRKKDGEFTVNFKGRRITYQEKDPVYDRHAIEFALRGFDYSADFKKMIRFHIPEFMIINTELEVVGEDTVSGPLGEISCWKVRMTPRILWIRWKFYFWIEKDYPHRFIKYEDSSGKNRILLVVSE